MPTNYPSEISALSSRIRESHLPPELLVQALTNDTFLEADEAGEMKGDADQLDYGNNDKFAAEGQTLVERITLSFVRQHWPSAPEEYICAIVAQLLSDEALTELAESLSLQHLVRTAEHPPEPNTLLKAVYALAGALGPAKAQNFIIRFILPRIVDLELEDVLPFRYPLPILKAYMRAWKDCEDVEPRELYTSGAENAISLHVAGIYADKTHLLGESPGEKLCIAVDLAAQDALLNLWDISQSNRVFPFNSIETYQERLGDFDRQNHSIRDICGESVDLTLLTPDELRQEPYDVAEVAKHYKEEVFPEVGYPHVKRLHHKFSRGSISRLSDRRFVRPLPHNI